MAGKKTANTETIFAATDELVMRLKKVVDDFMSEKEAVSHEYTDGQAYFKAMCLGITGAIARLLEAEKQSAHDVLSNMAIGTHPADFDSVEHYERERVALKVIKGRRGTSPLMQALEQLKRQTGAQQPPNDDDLQTEITSVPLVKPPKGTKKS